MEADPFCLNYPVVWKRGVFWMINSKGSLQWGWGGHSPSSCPWICSPSPAFVSSTGCPCLGYLFLKNVAVYILSLGIQILPMWITITIKIHWQNHNKQYKNINNQNSSHNALYLGSWQDSPVGAGSEACCLSWDPVTAGWTSLGNLPCWLCKAVSFFPCWMRGREVLQDNVWLFRSFTEKCGLVSLTQMWLWLKNVFKMCFLLLKVYAFGAE